MNFATLRSQFARIGARSVFRSGHLELNVLDGRDGEYFDIGAPVGARVLAVDVRPRDRHLLLFADGAKFLCGHDERHWFVAAVPEKAAGVRSVETAMEALKPVEVRAAQARLRVKRNRRNRRRNEAFRRQGEWFFVPAPRFTPQVEVLRNEPLVRGNGGKPHFMEYAVREGGTLVYVCHRYPNGLTEKGRRMLVHRQPWTKRLPWQAMRRNPRVHARGRIRHPDHATIRLDGWHRVLMNTENESKAMRNVAFLD